MVDDYSYRQYLAKKIRWYREHGYYDCLIQTWGGGDRDLRGQVLAELSKLRKPKRRKRAYKSVFRLRKHKGKKRGWIIPLALILALLFLGAFFSSLEVQAPVTKSEVPEAISRKREPEKELQAVRKTSFNRPRGSDWEVDNGKEGNVLYGNQDISMKI